MAHALYYLCAMPQYIEPLKREAEETIQEHGWTKTAMDAMWKADSLFKESLRLNGINHRTLSTLMEHVSRFLTLMTD